MRTLTISKNDIQIIRVSKWLRNNDVEFQIEKVRGKTNRTYFDTFVININDALKLREFLKDVEGS